MTQKTENRLIKLLTIIVAALALAVLIMLPHDGQAQPTACHADTAKVLPIHLNFSLMQDHIIGYISGGIYVTIP